MFVVFSCDQADSRKNQKRYIQRKEGSMGTPRSSCSQTQGLKSEASQRYQLFLVSTSIEVIVSIVIIRQFEHLQVSKKFASFISHLIFAGNEISD